MREVKNNNSFIKMASAKLRSLDDHFSLNLNENQAIDFMVDFFGTGTRENLQGTLSKPIEELILNEQWPTNQRIEQNIQETPERVIDPDPSDEILGVAEATNGYTMRVVGSRESFRNRVEVVNAQSEVVFQRGMTDTGDGGQHLADVLDAMKIIEYTKVQNKSFNEVLSLMEERQALRIGNMNLTPSLAGNEQNKIAMGMAHQAIAVYRLLSNANVDLENNLKPAASMMMGAPADIIERGTGLKLGVLLNKLIEEGGPTQGERDTEPVSTQHILFENAGHFVVERDGENGPVRSLTIKSMEGMVEERYGPEQLRDMPSAIRALTKAMDIGQNRMNDFLQQLLEEAMTEELANNQPRELTQDEYEALQRGIDIFSQEIGEGERQRIEPSPDDDEAAKRFIDGLSGLKPGEEGGGLEPPPEGNGRGKPPKGPTTPGF